MIGRWASALLLLLATSAIAGPPYDTDDPIPTDDGKWEIYGFAGGEGLGKSFDGSMGIDLNYGPVPDVQLTATLPLDVERGRRLSFRGGDIELGAKVRVLQRHDFAIALFPRAILPTAGGRTGGLLPIWAQRDWGKLSIFGGGGYAINPDPAGLDHWFGAVALTREVSERLSFGIEATRSGADTSDGRATSTLGIGGIRKVGGPFALLASAGPVFDDGGGPVHYHAYLALGASF